ncbi:MAG: hypothetical protein HOV81_03750 [Kofleriaceae bacterium]|nr:hypothetical protein [Kofleriaceae bacterium]
MTMTPEQTLKLLGRLVGSWTTEATHPAMPGVVVHGTADIEWLEGERFLINRSRTDHPEFPDSISIIGFSDSDRVDPASRRVHTAGQLTMNYFDSRGVSRILEASIDETAWRLSRIAPGFSQRFTGTFANGGNTIEGLWQLCEDETHWNDDVAITFRRTKT